MLKLSEQVLDEVAGLSPTALICVGGGYGREEVKTLFFKQKKPLSHQSILNPKQLAQLLIAPQFPADALLSVGARIELIRRLFSQDAVRQVLPIMSSQRQRPHFFENVDYSLQSGRRFFAHAEEAEVIQSRLGEIAGVNEKRDEFFLLNRFWEKVLLDRSLLDEARLFELAAQVNREQVQLALPFQRIYRMEHFILPPRLNYFWAELSGKIEVLPLHPPELSPRLILEKVQCHSLEDAAFYLFDEIEKSLKSPGSIEHALVIQDIPVVRRTVNRIAKMRGLSFFDPRDPMFLTLSESVKSDLLEFEMVAKNFSALEVGQWLGNHFELKQEAGYWRGLIQERGVQQGLSAYAGLGRSPKNHSLFEVLSEVDQRWPKRATLEDLKPLVLSRSTNHPFWELFFEDWIRDFRQVGIHSLKRPLRYWLEQLKEKLKTARPPSDSWRVKNGLHLFRVDQAVNLKVQPEKMKLHFFGVDSRFFEAKEWTNDWFTQKEVEVLSGEFGLVSQKELQKEKERSFLGWVEASQGAPARLWSYHYNEAGTETDSLDLALSELNGLEVLELPEQGAHPQFSASWTLQEAKVTEALLLPDALKSDHRYSMSFLDDYSECPFVAYASHVLRAYDEREADYELKGDSFGQLIHLALEKLIRNNLSPEAAFEEAWKESIKRGWFFSERILASIRNKCVSILAEFMVQELAYRARAKTETLAMEEDLKLELNVGDFVFSGRADRIDQHPEGLIVIDYKTQSQLTPGQDILEKGKSVQLALYGLALKERFNQEVVGAQYIKLSQKEVNRNQGILFKKWNGAKVDHAITAASPRNRAVIDLEPDQVWEQLRIKVIEKVNQLKTADFSPTPVDPKDCTSCRYQLSCGWLRRSQFGDASG